MCGYADMPYVPAGCRAVPKHVVVKRVFTVANGCQEFIRHHYPSLGHCPIELCDHATSFVTFHMPHDCAHCFGRFEETLGLGAPHFRVPHDQGRFVPFNPTAIGSYLLDPNEPAASLYPLPRAPLVPPNPSLSTEAPQYYSVQYPTATQVTMSTLFPPGNAGRLLAPPIPESYYPPSMRLPIAPPESRAPPVGSSVPLTRRPVPGAGRPAPAAGSVRFTGSNDSNLTVKQVDTKENNAGSETVDVAENVDLIGKNDATEKIRATGKNGAVEKVDTAENADATEKVHTTGTNGATDKADATSNGASEKDNAIKDADNVETVATTTPGTTKEKGAARTPAKKRVWKKMSLN